jgi:hypothetical protein
MNYSDLVRMTYEELVERYCADPESAFAKNIKEVLELKRHRAQTLQSWVTFALTVIVALSTVIQALGVIHTW